ncbi:sugar ABC transporter permease [Clostridia bacterium]|nr:sugar ABC transporter permease [Clostridia bacterium]
MTLTLKRKAHKEHTDWLALIILAALTVMVIFPIFWMLRTSLMSNAEVSKYPPRFLPSKWLFSNYYKTVTTSTFKFGLYLVNTLSIAIPSVVGVVITASMAAYAFARMDFRGKNLLFALCIGSMLMPAAVTIIPIFIMWSRMGFYNTYAPLIVPQFLGGGAFNIFLIRQFMLGIPRDLDEAGMIDGASHAMILVRILLPVLQPALITVGLFSFIMSWNDVLGPVIYLSDAPKYTISLGLAIFKGGYGTNWVAIMCASTLAVLPALALYIIGQKYFVEGIVLSGLKS